MQVESYITGRDYRILVVNGQIVAVAERVPAHVVGDGIHTVEQLIDITNSDPRRGVGHEKILTRISIDSQTMETLERQGIALDRCSGARSGRPAQADRQHEHRRHLDRPDRRHPPGQRGNCAAGGDGRRPGHRRHRLHHARYRRIRPRRPAARSSRSTPDPVSACTPTRPRATRAMSAAQSSTCSSRPARNRAIPIVAVTGTNGKTTTVRMIAHIMKTAGKRVGMTTTDGIYIDGTQIMAGDMSGPTSAQMVLKNPTDQLRGAGDRAWRHPALRSRLRPLRHRRRHQCRRRSPRSRRHRYAGRAGAGQGRGAAIGLPRRQLGPERRQRVDRRHGRARARGEIIFFSMDEDNAGRARASPRIAAGPWCCGQTRPAR